MKKIYLLYTLFVLSTIHAQIDQNLNKTSGLVLTPITQIDSIRFGNSQTMQVVLRNGSIINHIISEINNVTFSMPPYPSGTINCFGYPTAIVDVVNPTTGMVWMDRNLGASQVALNLFDVNSYGDLYQWGRRSDGHQCRNSPTTSALSTAFQPTHDNFITISYWPYDWLNPQNNNLWQGVNGINNPCPSGYRLPTEAELYLERNSWNTNNSGGAFSSPTKFPLSGFRDGVGGYIENTEIYGNYWCSNINGVYSRLLSFDATTSALTETFRADGSSVRCIKDGITIQGSISSLDCNTVVNNGTITVGTNSNNVNSIFYYTGGNSGLYSAQSIASSGVTGLTANLPVGYFANGNGTLTYTITGIPNTTGIANFLINIGGQSCLLSREIILPIGTISTLSCSSAITNGVLVANMEAFGVSTNISYTGGNGGTFNSQTIVSSGVTGLSAYLAGGIFNNGSGTLTYTITGIPNAEGIAIFSLNIGGKSCQLFVNVVGLATLYPQGTVFCSNGPNGTHTPTAIVNVINPSTGKTWMDRNLGASQVATNTSGANIIYSYGDLYQWGRRSDGHQCRNSYTTTTLSSSDQPAHGNFILPLITSSPPYDWRSPQNNDLWQGVNGINNPCPNGYRLPTISELEEERLSWGINNGNGAFSSPLKLTQAGYRNLDLNDGLIDYVGQSGRYWSSTASFGVSGVLFFSNTNNNQADTSYGHRGFGCSVRCIKN